MRDGRVDISILQPFTRDQIEGYVSFLRNNGESWLATAVESEVDKHPFMLRDSPQPPEGQH